MGLGANGGGAGLAAPALPRKPDCASLPSSRLAVAFLPMSEEPKLSTETAERAWRICSSVKVRSFFCTTLTPSLGKGASGMMVCSRRPSAWMWRTTCERGRAAATRREAGEGGSHE